jgi:hypothetical protein
MMRLFAALLVALSMCAHGQTKPQPEQTCPKYQHEETIHTGLNCVGDLIAGPGDHISCVGDHAGCVDDLHFVTEKEWQDLMQRLTALEYPWPKLSKREKP